MTPEKASLCNALFRMSELVSFETGGFFTAPIYTVKIPLKCTFQLSCKHQLLCAVQTADVDVLGSPDRITAAGAVILPGGTRSGDWWRRCRCVCAGACDSETAVFVAVDKDVSKVIVQAELQKTVTGACDCPSV